MHRKLAGWDLDVARRNLVETSVADNDDTSYRVTFMTPGAVATDVPIDIETFDEATENELDEPTNAEKVIRFLVRNDDRAFTPSEIAEGTGVKKSSIGTVLRRLEDRDLVRHKGDYWAIGDRETVRDAYDFHRTLADLDKRFGEEDREEWRKHAAGDVSG